MTDSHDPNHPAAAPHPEPDPRAADPVTIDVINWEGWRISVHWHRFGLDVAPVGVDVRAFDGDPDDPDSTTYPRTPVEPVSRDRMNSIPWGRLLRESRERAVAAAAHDAAILAGFGGRTTTTTSPAYEAAAGLRKPSSRPVSKASAEMDENYRMTAQVYGEEYADDPSTAALRTWQRLTEAGVVDSRGNPPSRGLVRQWVREARRRGYLPEGEQ